MTKILFVCSANIDRSPSVEHIYANQTGLEVKSAISHFLVTEKPGKSFNFASS